MKKLLVLTRGQLVWLVTASNIDRIDCGFDSLLVHLFFCTFNRRKKSGEWAGPLRLAKRGRVCARYEIHCIWRLRRRIGNACRPSGPEIAHCPTVVLIPGLKVEWVYRVHLQTCPSRAHQSAKSSCSYFLRVKICFGKEIENISECRFHTWLGRIYSVWLSVTTRPHQHLHQVSVGLNACFLAMSFCTVCPIHIMRLSDN